jgi:hypothetical protein
MGYDTAAMPSRVLLDRGKLGFQSQAMELLFVG